MSDWKLGAQRTLLVAALVTAMTPDVLAASSAYYEHSHPCNRPCEDASGQSMVCYYRFTVEWYYTLSKACFDCPFNASDCARPHCIANNGVEKAVLVANRQLPGPSIEVCENDTIIVDVQNHAGAEATVIHWHGIHHVSSPHMDGVAMITQCPILSHNTFRYDFKASPSGTHFWHSHAGLQRSDGLHGMLVVRQAPSVDPHFHLYDYDMSEHMMMVTDWLSELSFDRFVAHHHQNGSNKPESMLVNGKGRLRPFLDRSRSNDTVYTPIEVFTVTRGFRYRFRMASNGILNCPIQVSIDNHTMVVIATDGQPVEPLKVDSLVIYAGERFDFILNANQQRDNYLIRLRGLLDCDERFTKASQVALLRYAGAAPFDDRQLLDLTYEDMDRAGKLLNPLNSGTVGESKVSVASLVSILEDDETSKAEPDVRFYLPYDFMVIDNKHFHDPSHYPVHAVQRNRRLYTPQINNISFVFPSAPLLTQPEATPAHHFCNHTNPPGGQDCSKEFCECIYTLNIPLDSVVELVIVDLGFAFDANHPIHIHGLSFRVVGMERIGKNVTMDEIMRMEAAGQIKRNLKRPVAKDTVTVPDGGYTIVRFVASNPGFWLLHCHIEFHIEIGMGLLLKVGELKDMKKTPPQFPKCGNWPADVNGRAASIMTATRASLVLAVFVLLTWTWVAEVS